MRVFKTKWFAREARSHAITDEELCRAILETEQGKADALGGGVAKQDMSNINSQELAGFRELAKHYAFLTKAQLTAMINTKELTEICYDCKN